MKTALFSFAAAVALLVSTAASAAPAFDHDHDRDYRRGGWGRDEYYAQRPRYDERASYEGQYRRDAYYGRPDYDYGYRRGYDRGYHRDYDAPAYRYGYYR